MKQPKNKKRGIKKGLEEDIERNYTWNQVKTILDIEGLDKKEFNNWMGGQTCPMIKVDGEMEVGYYGYDLFRWIQYKKKGIIPIWD